MDLKQLEALGAFKDRSLVKRTVEITHNQPLPASEWSEEGVPEYSPDPSTSVFDVFVKKRSSADSIELSSADRRLIPFYDIFRCIVDEKGQQVFPTIEHAMALEEPFVLALFNAVSEVNRSGPKLFPPTTKPGASSRSDSGGARSRSGKKQSPRKS